MTDKKKLVKCYYLRVFDPPTRAPSPWRTVSQTVERSTTQPFLDRPWTVRAPHIDRPRNICHHVGANASFKDGRFWTSDVPSRRFTWSVRTYIRPLPVCTYGESRDEPMTTFSQRSVFFLNPHGKKVLHSYIYIFRFRFLSHVARRCFLGPPTMRFYLCLEVLSTFYPRNGRMHMLIRSRRNGETPLTVELSQKEESHSWAGFWLHAELSFRSRMLDVLIFNFKPFLTTFHFIPPIRFW